MPLDSIVNVLNLAGLSLTNGLALLVAWTSFREDRQRGAVIAVLFAFANSLMWLIFLLWGSLTVLRILNMALLLVLFLLSLFSVLKYFPGIEEFTETDIQPFDERDNMFSRNNLKFYSELADRYYKSRPENLELDRAIHDKAELGASSHTYYDPYGTPITDAAFSLLDRGRGLSVGPVAPEKKQVDEDKMASAIRLIARYYGAVDVGFANLKAYHLYSHSGRHAEGWGKEIQTAHSHAVVIVVAMDLDMIAGAPALPSMLESSRQYVEAAKIANLIAEYIRLFGYSARSHTDGNYETLCVPLAVDAGLGELGRLGILMHPTFGPCIRLSVVTTELELPLSPHKHGYIHEFCLLCKKCSDNCPTASIETGGEPSSRGFSHWSINQESCYSYWKTAGTDCAVCIRVCPFSKPDTLLHRLVRYYISRNRVNQRIALYLDDLLYGRRIKIPAENRGPLIPAVKEE